MNPTKILPPVLSALFLVTFPLAADVHVFFSSPSAFLVAPLDPGSDLTVQLSIANAGQSDVHDVVVTLTPSGGAGLTGATMTDGSPCDPSLAGEITCRVGVLGPAVRKVAISVRTGPWNGKLQGLRAAGTASDATVSSPQDFLVPVYRWFEVTTTNDSGAGSLRQAILDTNGACVDETECKIAFRIPATSPAPRWFTIAPISPLPPVGARRITIDGSTQTSLTGDTNLLGPEIELSGAAAGDSDGLFFHLNCSATVNDLAIGGFQRNGIEAESSLSAPCVNATDGAFGIEISRNAIGTDPTQREARPNFRGIGADALTGVIRDNTISGNLHSGIWKWSGDNSPQITGNRIGVAGDGSTPLPNGASGIFLGPDSAGADIRSNVIGFNREMGVAVARGVPSAVISGNTFIHNGGLPIDLGLDGTDADSNLPEHPNSPVLTSATYDPATNVTTINYILDNPGLIFSNVFNVEVFASDDPTAGGERSIGGDLLVVVGVQAGSINIRADLTGQWLTATSTRSQFEAKLAGASALTTSEMSNAVHVERR